MTDDARSRPHPHYGTCAGCGQLKHVTPDGLLRSHNRFAGTGTVVCASRCPGSGLPYREAGAAGPAAGVSEGPSGSHRRAG